MSTAPPCLPTSSTIESSVPAVLDHLIAEPFPIAPPPPNATTRGRAAGTASRAYHRGQFAASCDRLLLVEDDLAQAGLGWTAEYFHAAMILAHKDKRVLVEVPSAHPRWCDRPPYTLQCLFAPWSPCATPSRDAAVRAARPPALAEVPTDRGWPRDASLVFLSLSRLRPRHLPPHDAPTAPVAYALLLRPRAWVRELGGCVMAAHGLVPGHFVSVHVRSSPEKAAELARHGVSAPPSASLHELALSVGKQLGLRRLFVQTASPSALTALKGFANATRYFRRIAYTNNQRSENDAWGGWASGSEMGQAAVAAVNLHIGASAGALIGPEGSLWTGLVVDRMDGGSALTRYVDCGGSLITLAVGVRAAGVRATGGARKLSPLLPLGAACKWSSRLEWGRRQTAPVAQFGQWLKQTFGRRLGSNMPSVAAAPPRAAPQASAPRHASVPHASVPAAVVLAGPHKTASTHLQLFLVRNRKALAEQGWRWPSAPLSSHPASAKGLAFLAPALLGRRCAVRGADSSLAWWATKAKDVAPRCHGDPPEVARLSGVAPEKLLGALGHHLHAGNTSAAAVRPLLATEELDMLGSDLLSSEARHAAFARLHALLRPVGSGDGQRHAAPVVVVVVLRRPHVDHLRSGWSEWLLGTSSDQPPLQQFAQLAERWLHGAASRRSFSAFACAQLGGKGDGHARLPWFDPLGLAATFGAAGFHTVVIDSEGARSAGRDLSDVLSCDVLRLPCDASGVAPWAAGRADVDYSRGAASGRASQLTPAAEAALEAYFGARDCAMLAMWHATAKSHPPKLLHAGALTDACATRAGGANATAEEQAEMLRLRFVNTHCL